MAQAIVIKAGDGAFEAELNDGVTGKAIFDALPIKQPGCGGAFSNGY